MINKLNTGNKGNVRRYKQQQALNRDLEYWTLGHNIFGTLKFANGNQTHPLKADKVIKRFWNTLDRTWYSASAVKKEYQSASCMLQALRRN